MCGIYCSVGLGSYIRCSQSAQKLLEGRGPDSVKEISFTLDRPTRPNQVSSKNEQLNIHVVSTVLALRGDHVEPQPLQSEHSQSFLCWNGEAWKHNDRVITGNDSQHVFNLLSPTWLSPQAPDEGYILDALTSIAGPFAFIFYDARSCRLFYGRDHLGRRSLLSRTYPTGAMVFCSVTDNIPSPEWEEVKAGGVHFIDLSSSSLISTHLISTVNRVTINRDLPQSQISVPRIPAAVVSNLERHLQDSLRLRIADIPDLGGASENRTVEDAKIAVLFSGGLDCTVLARLAHDQLPLDEPIDLLNVAFENPRSIAAASKLQETTSVYESCPDRKTGRSSYLELLSICNGRKWRFLAIDVPYSESESHHDNIVRLMSPHNTEMDLSIAKALYFAARGQGQATDALRQQHYPYSTRARVLLSGLGADELFGGYNRHAIACSRQGYLGLINELQLDVQRIGQRNLGRDDRIISHWAKEVRYPYLDEDFMKWALQLPVWEKCSFVPENEVSNKENVDPVTPLDPAKQVLRLLAWRLGLEYAATLKKRAIQFGARTAKMKMGTGRRKGTEVIT